MFYYQTLDDIPKMFKTHQRPRGLNTEDCEETISNTDLLFVLLVFLLFHNE
jgi:hypothetical protein